MARSWSPWRRRRATEYREERVAVPPRSRPFWPWLLLLLLLVLGALAASWYLANRDETVDAEEVPNVVGLERAAAEQRLEREGFEAEVKRVVRRARAGTVVEQRPNAGTLYGERGIVVLAVARDPITTEVPDVSGLTTARALARLRGADLRPRAQAVTSREPRGTVLRQLPEAGTEVPNGSPAIVVVSSGPQLATVPEVVGLTVGAATSRLTQAGFRSRVARVPGTEPEGTVIAQDPRGGGRRMRGTVVRINVSMGQGGGTTTVVTTTRGSDIAVPDVVGMDVAMAQSTVEGEGFVANVVERSTTDPNEDGVVLQQSPRGGARAPSGASVTIFVGRLG